MSSDTLIRNVSVIDGSGTKPFDTDVYISKGTIKAVQKASTPPTHVEVFDGHGLCLCPGFIDVHAHDDIHVISHPSMLSKLSQGVTTVIVGNCGVSAAPFVLGDDQKLPEPINLLGDPEDFRYPTFSKYVEAVTNAYPTVNVAALVGHTSLRSNNMEDLDRAATGKEIAAMKRQLRDALEQGALGLSTGLAYSNACQAPISEIQALVEELSGAGGVYTTHLRSEFDEILEAIDEALTVTNSAKVPLVISHLKCAGKNNWGRAQQVLKRLEQARKVQPVGWDCYPYTASSTVLDLKQVTDDFDIRITWSQPHAEARNKLLSDVAREWKMDIMDAARKLQPAGAVYHNMQEKDMHAFLLNPAAMIGSDGLPKDPHPHPRLWGTFPRVLAKFCREENTLSLPDAVHKMSQLPARRFGLNNRGQVHPGYAADLVLFDPEQVSDMADYKDSQKVSKGIEAVWVNGELSYKNGETCCAQGHGRFLHRCEISQKIPY